MALETILNRCRPIRERRMATRSLDSLLEEASRRRDFRSIKQRLASGFGIIAEVKKASPSEGLLVARYRPERIAEEYEAAGAAAISVLTCRPFFLGDIAHLVRVRRRISIPVLRKDFLIDTYDVAESAAYGADAVLLIARLLDDRSLAALCRLAGDLRMEVVLETHDERDLERCLGLVQSDHVILGINNRDLDTLKTDVSTTFRLMKRIPCGILPRVCAVSESGLRWSDARAVREAGLCGILVGTSLLKAADRGDALRRFLCGRRIDGSQGSVV